MRKCAILAGTIGQLVDAFPELSPSKKVKYALLILIVPPPLRTFSPNVNEDSQWKARNTATLKVTMKSGKMSLTNLQSMKKLAEKIVIKQKGSANDFSTKLSKNGNVLNLKLDYMYTL